MDEGGENPPLLDDVDVAGEDSEDVSVGDELVLDILRGEHRPDSEERQEARGRDRARK